MRPVPPGPQLEDSGKSWLGRLRLVLVLFFLPDELFLSPFFSVRKTKRVVSAFPRLSLVMSVMKPKHSSSSFSSSTSPLSQPVAVS